MANEKIARAETQPAPVQPPMRQKFVERQNQSAVPYTQRYPDVRGGICEYCGVIDKNLPSEYQYKLCEHYRGIQLRCSYCDETKDPDDIVIHSNLTIHGHPDNPDKMVVCCNSYTCARAHENRFKPGGTR